MQGGFTIHRRRGRQLSRRGCQHTNLPDFPKNCMKLRKILVRGRRPLLGSATGWCFFNNKRWRQRTGKNVAVVLDRLQVFQAVQFEEITPFFCASLPRTVPTTSSPHGTLQSCWKPLTPEIYYRPQTKFAKVMFLHMSVCPQGEYLGRYTPWAGIHPPGQVHPPGRYPPGQVHTPLARYTPPWPGTSPGQVHPWAGTPLGRYTSHPPAMHQCMLGYGQQAGSTHPTGMHSCQAIAITIRFKNELCIHFCNCDCDSHSLCRKQSQCMQYRQPENFEALLGLGSFLSVNIDKHFAFSLSLDVNEPLPFPYFITFHFVLVFSCLHPCGFPPGTVTICNI